MTTNRPSGPTRSSPDREVGVTDPQTTPPRPGGPVPPFQFTLSQLLVLMAWVALALALTVQGGLSGFWLWLTPTSIVAILIGYRKKDSRLTTAGVFGCFVSFALFCVLGIQEAHGPSAKKAHCSNNLRQIVLALENYHDTHGRFPPPFIADANGKPMHSWRVLILPYLDQKTLYNQYRFDEPWDGPNNRTLHKTRLTIFECPSQEDKPPRCETNYVAVCGPKTAWEVSDKVSFIRMADILDGISNTIQLVELADSGIHWMEPRDLHINQMPLMINAPRGQGISCHHHGGAHVVSAFGGVHFLSNTTPPDTLRAYLTRSGKEKVPPLP